MKKRGMTYSDLGQHMGVSHSTIKRIMTREELSLNRLLVICEHLDLTLAELEALAGESLEKAPPMFTTEQETILASSPEYFAYLAALYTLGSPQEIAKKYHLSESTTDLYLRRLEQLGLVKVSALGKASPKYPTLPRWNPDGPLGETYIASLIQKFANFFAGKDQTPKGATLKVAAFSYPMSQKIYQAMSKSLDELLTKYKEMARIEEKLEHAKPEGYAVLMLNHCWTENRDLYEEMSKFFGEVPPLD
jgi:transcriptional regulator with XRE-family HTH domain